MKDMADFKRRMREYIDQSEWFVPNANQAPHSLSDAQWAALERIRDARACHPQHKAIAIDVEILDALLGVGAPQTQPGDQPR